MNEKRKKEERRKKKKKRGGRRRKKMSPLSINPRFATDEGLGSGKALVGNEISREKIGERDGV
jgi:hypothetical protein